MQNAPIRMCAVCRKHQPQDDMIRIVKSADKLHVTNLRKVCGRSVYLCLDSECIDKAQKSNLIERTLGLHDENIYEDIRAEYERRKG